MQPIVSWLVIYVYVWRIVLIIAINRKESIAPLKLKVYGNRIWGHEQGRALLIGTPFKSYSIECIYDWSGNRVPFIWALSSAMATTATSLNNSLIAIKSNYARCSGNHKLISLVHQNHNAAKRLATTTTNTSSNSIATLHKYTYTLRTRM